MTFKLKLDGFEVSRASVTGFSTRTADKQRGETGSV